MTAWDWQDRAACREYDVVDFFGPDGERQADREVREDRARIVCAACPVRQDCLEHALAKPERYGVWGGLSEAQRDLVQRRRRRQPERRVCARPGCGRPLAADAAATREYCSAECRKPRRHCPVCDVALPRESQAQYCSPRCHATGAGIPLARAQWQADNRERRNAERRAADARRRVCAADGCGQLLPEGAVASRRYCGDVCRERMEQAARRKKAAQARLVPPNALSRTG